LSAAATLWLMSGPEREKAVLATVEPEAIQTLERGAASRADDPEAIRLLAQAYLDVRQPGLAVTLVEQSRPRVREDARVQHVYARALIDQGRSEDALAAEGCVLAACRPLAEAGTPVVGCDAVLFASATRRWGILSELVALGVHDAQAQPEVALVAYQNATREARVMVQ
jgi:hypothetical protein